MHDLKPQAKYKKPSIKNENCVIFTKIHLKFKKKEKEKD